MKVSVVVCILNGSRYITELIDYLRTQTHRDIETIFVVSSRTTDDSLELVKEQSASLPGSVIIEYLDVGKLGGSKNCGLAKATGDCVWFLDVDDRPSRRYLEHLTRIMEEKNADVVGCNYVYGDGWPSEGDYDKRYLDVMDSGEALRRRLTERFPVASWSMIYSTELISKNGLRFNEGMCEDIEFTVSALERSETVCYYGDVLYSYRIHTDSFTATGSDERGEREIEIYSEMIGSCGDAYRRERMALTMLRSMGHMSFPRFVSALYGSDVRDAMTMYGGIQSKFEYSFMSVLPAVYYAMIRLFFRGYFYRPGRTFTRR